MKSLTSEQMEAIEKRAYEICSKKNGAAMLTKATVRVWNGDHPGSIMQDPMAHWAIGECLKVVNKG